jgi:hypothetical protein
MEEAVVGGPGLESSEAPIAPAGEPGPEAPVIEGNSATDTDDADFVYDCTHFCKYKAYHQFRDDYTGAKSLWRKGSRSDKLR